MIRINLAPERARRPAEWVSRGAAPDRVRRSGVTPAGRVARREHRKTLFLEERGRLGRLDTFQEGSRILVLRIRRLGNRVDDRRVRILGEGSHDLHVLFGMRVGGIDDAERGLARVRGQFAGEDAQQRGLAHAVGAHEPGMLPRRHAK